MEEKISATKEEIAAAFTEWERRYQDDPESFAPENGTPQDYGQVCAPFFIQILAEVKATA
jgi:hypothetical protein